MRVIEKKSPVMPVPQSAQVTGGKSAMLIKAYAPGAPAGGIVQTIEPHQTYVVPDDATHFMVQLTGRTLVHPVADAVAQPAPVVVDDPVTQDPDPVIEPTPPAA